jgi:hypothetical protein
MRLTDMLTSDFIVFFVECPVLCILMVLLTAAFFPPYVVYLTAWMEGIASFILVMLVNGWFDDRRRRKEETRIRSDYPLLFPGTEEATE